MFRIIKHMKGQEKAILAILLLLVIQAFCDLALPQYTSDIIDTGIQNKGVVYVMPEKMTKEEYESAACFMTEEERSLWQKLYQEKKNCYQRTATKKELKEYDDRFALPVILNGQVPQKAKQAIVQQMQGENKEAVSQQLLAKRQEMEQKMDAMGDSMVHSTAVACTVKQEQLAGVDVDHKQTMYLWYAGGKMLSMAFIMALAAIGVGYFASRVGAGVGRNLRSSVYEKVVGFSDTEMNRFSTASLITRSTNDIQQLQMVCTMFLRMVAYAPIIGIGGIIKVAQTGAGMGWVIVLAVVVISGFVLLLMSIAMPKFKSMQKLVDRLNLVSREILTGLLVIRAFGREQREEERFEQANRDLTKTMLFTNRTMTFMMPVMMLMMNGLSVLIVWVAAHRIDAGSMQVGTMTAFITYAMLIVMSFLMLTMLSVMMPRAAVAAERIDEVLETKAEICDAEDAEDLEHVKGVVRFDHVNFCYPGSDENVLKDIDFTAEPGQTTAIIGSTGCGKSTLLQLIPRFYDVSEGSVSIDGKDVRTMTQSSLHEQIGYVPQKGVLFSGTIASNLRFGREDATDEEIRKAAQIAQATEFIDGKEQGYESPIAQGGTNVSGGQKQRLSIARAIAKNPKIYLFDDSFSALDFKTDAALRRALQENVQDSTVIIVAQRISTVLHAEQILVLDDGQIVGKGTHEELMHSCEVYQQIARSQLSEQELAGQGKEAGQHE